MPNHTHVVLPGSRRPARSGSVRVADVDPQAPIEVTVTVRGPELPAPGEPISPEKLASDYGADPADLDAVTAAMEDHGLTVRDASSVKRSVTVEGTAEQIEDAFRPGLGIYRSADQGEYRGREGQVQVPAELSGIVTGVFGLDERRVARRRTAPAGVLTTPLGPGELESHYNFPPGDAAGQVVAVAEFGGGIFPDDLQEYCTRHGRPVPPVTAVGVGLQPLTPQQIAQLPQQQQQEALGESVEVMMDIEIIAGLCPGAEISVYFAPFTQKGWIDLINAVIADQPAAVALSISWGLSEDAPSWTAAARQLIDQRLQAAALLGITTCVASGDDGSGDQMSDGRAHVDFPSVSPNVLSVGGTKLDGEDEVVWWDAPGDRANGGGSTGGGVSDHFVRPAYQADIDVPSLNHGSIDGRVVPDVAALAGAPFYEIVFEGSVTDNGGTSASAPLWASLIARIAQARGGTPLGFLTPLLYENGPSGAPRGSVGCLDVTSGDNQSPDPGRGYQAGPGFDAVSGWGVPDGAALLNEL